jgi:negative regulator of flagellin synthesis FlgM
MEIRGLQGIQSISGLTSAGKTGRSNSAAEAAPSSLAPVDELDLSAEAQAMGSVSGVTATSETAAADGGIRTEKVAALRRAIADGNYDTPERMSAALDRFLDEYA